MRVEWFIYSNMDVFLRVEMITCVFNVFNGLLNPGGEGSTVRSHY